MPSGYIPAPNADFNNWLQNFASLITGAPTTFGLVSGDAMAIQAQADAYDLAFTQATDPGTRGPATVAAAVTARATAEAIVRPYATRIAANPAVTDADKVAVGVTVRLVTRPRIPAPTTAPSLILVSLVPGLINLQFRDSTTPLVKAKPFGVIGIQLWAAFGTVPAVGPDATQFQTVFTKTPAQLPAGGQSGKTCTMYARWQNRSGSGGVAFVGPWSAQLVTVVV